MHQRDEKFPLKRSHAAGAFPSWRHALSHFSYLQHDRKCPVSKRPFDNLNSSWHYFREGEHTNYTLKSLG